MNGFKPPQKPIAPVNPIPPVREYQSIAVDSKVQPRSTLLTHVEGSRWIVDYYSQLVTPDSEVTAQEVNRPEVYQQYVEILKFELKVTEPLSASQDPETNEFTYVGGATLYPSGVIPNVGDMFTADIGDGRLGLFTLTAVEQRSVLRDATYAVRYMLVDYLDAIRADDLHRKVTKRTHYVRDFIAIGKSPVLVQSEYDTYQSLLEWIRRLPDTYFDEFFSHEYKTFLVPDQSKPLYDPFLTKFVSELVPTSRHPEYMALRVLNVEPGRPKTPNTLWDSLLERSDRHLDYGVLKMEIQSTESHYHRPRQGSIAYTGIPSVVQPIDNTVRFGTKLRNAPEPSKPRSFQRPIELGAVITDHTLDGLMEPGGTLPPDAEPAPLIKPATGEYYVLSETFYLKQYAETSILERLICQYLKRQALNHQALLQLCTASLAWGQVERFYYLPLLYVLLNVSVGDIN